MIKIQDTIKRAIELYGPDILKKKKSLCMLIEDLSPQLSDELAFIDNNYDDRFGALLYEAYTAKDVNRGEILIEADNYLQSQKGLNNDWRNRFWLYFGEIAGKPKTVKKTVQPPNQVQNTRQPDTQNIPVKISTSQQVQLYKKYCSNITIAGCNTKIAAEVIKQTLRNAYSTAMLLTDDNDVLLELLAGSYVVSLSRFDMKNIRTYSEELIKTIFGLFVKVNNLKSGNPSATIINDRFFNSQNSTVFRYSGETGVLNCISDLGSFDKVVIVSGAFSGLDIQFLSEILGKNFNILQRYFAETLCDIFARCDYFDSFSDNSVKYSELKKLLQKQTKSLNISKSVAEYVFSAIKICFPIIKNVDASSTAQNNRNQPTKPSPKFCIKCGSPLEKNAKFCIKCGFKLS